MKSKHLEFSDGMTIKKMDVSSYEVRNGIIVVKLISGLKITLTKEQTQEFSDYYELNIS